MTKKIISLIGCLFFALTIFAQGHLTFKGIPMTGSMTSFCTQMNSKGFRLIQSDGSAKLFKGKFTGREVEVIVGATDDGKNVHSIVVIVNESKEWSSLNDTYSYYKKIYTMKYGEPSACVEDKSSMGEMDNAYMLELQQGGFTYASGWTVEGGDIELSIEKSGTLQGVVLIRYLDKQNIKAKIQKDLDDI